MSTLTDYLRDKKDKIVREVTVLEPQWSCTYGAQDPKETSIDIVDFEALLQEIDNFTESLKDKQ